MRIRKVLKAKECIKIESDGGEFIIAKNAVSLISGDDDDDFLEIVFIPEDCLDSEVSVKLDNRDNIVLTEDKNKIMKRLSSIDEAINFIYSKREGEKISAKLDNCNKINKINKLFIRFKYDDAFFEYYKDSFEVLYDIDEIERDEEIVERQIKEFTKV